tara:strand:+ start:3547 stop:4371 length:825 start_codon:yes stop_codon:yes gene_type:complete
MVLATALTLASVGSQLAGSGMSFAAARKQKRAQAQAEKEADIAMASARQSLEKNYMDSLAIQKEPYELERDAALVAGAQATEALRESDRGMGRVGAIYGQQQQAQRQIASAMGQEMFNLDYLSAQEDTRLRDIGTQLDLGEVTGAQLAAANAEERRAQQLQAGVAGIGGAAMTGLDSLALYGKAPTSKQVIGSETKGLKPSEAQKSRYNINTPVPPQLSETPLQKIMRTQQADQSLNTPIGAPLTNFMLPPERGVGSNYMRSNNTTNPFSYLAY